MQTVKQTTHALSEFADATVGQASKVTKATVGQASNVAKATVGQATKVTKATTKIAGATVGQAGRLAVGTVGTAAQLAGDAAKKVQQKVHLPLGGRRGLKRQNSLLAWESRLTPVFVKLHVTLECRKLPPKDSFSQADAFCGLWEVPAAYRSEKVHKLPGGQEREIGRTEVMRATENPKFKTTFTVEYRYQEQQTFVVRVYDEDLRYATDLKEHDFVGGCLLDLGELVGAPGCAVAKSLSNGKAFVIVTGSEISESREVLEFRFSGEELGVLKVKKKKNVARVAQTVTHDVLDNLRKINETAFSSFDAYFKLEKLKEEDKTWTEVWKSEVVLNSHNPTWNAARIPLQLLCDDHPDNSIKISLFDWNNNFPDEFEGFVESTVNELVKKSKRGIPVYDVMTERRKLLGGTKLKKAGSLKVLKASILQIPSMVQFLAGGCRLDLMVAIDCTYTNGDMAFQKSLHYSSDTWLNDYQAVLLKIGNIFDGYAGQGYIMWGYGNEVKGSKGGTDASAPPYFVIGDKIRGADNLVKAYDKTFTTDNKQLEFGEKACLQQLIQAATFRASAANTNGKQGYGVLVILTTGLVSDATESIDAICTAAEDAPLSIVLIGIGENKFDTVQSMVRNEKGKLEDSNGVPIARDNITFVSLAEFEGNVRECVAEGLHEIPEQFVQHFVNSGTIPFPPKAVPDFSPSSVFGGGGKSASDEDDDDEEERNSSHRKSGRSKDGDKQGSSRQRSKSSDPGRNHGSSSGHGEHSRRSSTGHIKDRSDKSSRKVSSDHGGEKRSDRKSSDKDRKERKSSDKDRKSSDKDRKSSDKDRKSSDKERKRDKSSSRHRHSREQ